MRVGVYDTSFALRQTTNSYYGYSGDTRRSSLIAACGRGTRRIVCPRYSFHLLGLEACVGRLQMGRNLNLLDQAGCLSGITPSHGYTCWKMVNVGHVIRTYCIHGGETQLAQMLRGENSGYCESFFFVFRDRACEAYFRKIPRLQLFTLLPVEIKPGASRWSELLITLTFWPILQVRLIWALRKARAKICIAHGFQAAFVSWPAAVVFRNVIKFGYVHRSTKSRIGRSRFFSLLYAPYRVVAGVSESVAASLRSS